MKKLLIGVGSLFALNSCIPKYSSYPVTNTAANSEKEYQKVLKGYQSETAEVLTYLLNGESPEEPNTAFTVENTSKCNMVLTVTGNRYYKKIPIAAGKTGSVMIPKNQTYQLTGMVCNSSYQATKFIATSYSVKLSN